MITKRDLIARGKQYDNKKEITPSYKNDPIAQEITRIYNSYPRLTSLTKVDQDRIEDLRKQQKTRDYRLSQEYDATHSSHTQTEQPLTEAERRAERFVRLCKLIKK